MAANSEIKKYFKVLSSNYPTFINKYIQTPEMQRLGGIGQFCGCDYTKLYSCKYWYTRLDHSIATALMTWYFTKDKTQTLSALFHDLGTPVFSHCIDFMLGDAMNQESAEIDVKEVILSSKEITNLLKKDNINVEDVIKIEKYTIIENKKPKLCIDRLEGVLHTGLIWLHFWTIKEIEEIYSNIEVLINECNEQEIGFKNIEIAEKFYDGIYKYSIALQSNEANFTSQFIANNIKYLIAINKIRKGDLYLLSEKEIIDVVKAETNLKGSWEKFENSSILKRTNKEPNAKHYITKVDSKKRYVIPLVIFEGKTVRLDKVSNRCNKLLKEYLNYEDSIYAYIE